MSILKRILLLSGISLILLGVYLLYDSYTYNAELCDDVRNELHSNHIVEEVSSPEVSPSKVSDKKHKVKKKIKTYKNVLKISELKLVAPILPDISRESLRKGVGHYPETVPIGEKGNCVLAGHSSYVYDCIFNSLHKIKRGTKIKVYDENSKEFDYVVTDTIK